MGRRYVFFADLVGRVASPWAADTPRAVADLVLVPGRSAGGPDQLTADVVDALIVSERTGAATVLLAAARTDLDSSVAAVCRMVAGTRPDVLEEARRRFGDDRVQVLPSIDPADARAWTKELRAATGPPSSARPGLAPLRRRIMSLRAGYGKIRDRNVGPRGAEHSASDTPLTLRASSRPGRRRSDD